MYTEPEVKKQILQYSQANLLSLTKMSRAMGFGHRTLPDWIDGKRSPTKAIVMAAGAWLDRMKGPPRLLEGVIEKNGKRYRVILEEVEDE